MTKYRQNQNAAAAMFEKRKRDMLAKPQEGPYPYIDPSDENSKFYTKPDVPPIPHPAEIVEELRKEFPDKTFAELVKMADDKVQQVIEERRAASGPSVTIEAVPEGDETNVEADDEVPETPE